MAAWSPPGNPFTYLAVDLMTGAALDSLPYEGVTFGRIKNQPGPFAGNLPLASKAVQRLAWQQATRPGRTGMFVEFDGQLLWGGIIWRDSYDSSDPTRRLKIGGLEFGSWMQQRRQVADYSTTYTPPDGTPATPMAIAQRIYLDTAAFSTILGGIPLVINAGGAVTSPAPISPSYPGTSAQMIDAIIQTLSQLGFTEGFDYSWDVAFLPGTRQPAVTCNLWYPRQGRVAAASQIAIENQNAHHFTYDFDSQQQGDRVLTTGSGTGAVPEVATAEQVLAAGWPLLDKVVSRTQISDPITLANAVLGDLATFCWPVATMSVYMPLRPTRRDQPFLPLTGFQLGDDLTYRIDAAVPDQDGDLAFGINADPRFPDGMDYEWQIVSWSCTPEGTGGPPLYKLDLAIPPFDAAGVAPPIPPGLLVPGGVPLPPIPPPPPPPPPGTPTPFVGVPFSALLLREDFTGPLDPTKWANPGWSGTLNGVTVDPANVVIAAGTATLSLSDPSTGAAISTNPALVSPGFTFGPGTIIEWLANGPPRNWWAVWSTYFTGIYPEFDLGELLGNLPTSNYHAWNGGTQIGPPGHTNGPYSAGFLNKMTYYTLRVNNNGTYDVWYDSTVILSGAAIDHIGTGAFLNYLIANIGADPAFDTTDITKPVVIDHVYVWSV